MPEMIGTVLKAIQRQQGGYTSARHSPTRIHSYADLVNEMRRLGIPLGAQGLMIGGPVANSLLELAAWLTAITVTSWALNVQRYRARVLRRSGCGMRRTSRNPGILTP
jgi:hypothetical protein